MHVVVALEGELRVDWGEGRRTAAGVVTAPDVAHAIDGRRTEVMLVFLDPADVRHASLGAAPGHAVARSFKRQGQGGPCCLA